MPILHGNPDFLMHYGVLGQKWGVRRFQNEDGTLTEAGKQRYGTDSTGRHIGRAILNTSVGQRLAVSLNKGYRADKKDIKSERDLKKEEIMRGDSVGKKEQLKQLKRDYKKTLAEARTSAAQANYSWQDDDANERIQSQKVAKALFTSFMSGSGYGGLTYDRMRSRGNSRLLSWAAGLLATMADSFTGGIVGLGDYGLGVYKSKQPKT